jgi:hypothetical protein
MSDGALPLTPPDPQALQQALTQMSPAVTGQQAPPNMPQQTLPPAMPPPEQAQPPLDVNLGTATQGQQKPQTAPPKQSAVPALAGFLQQMIKGPGYEGGTGSPGSAGSQPGRPISRLDSFESFIGNFLNSFSQGMSNAGTGPAANARGFGAAVQAPYQRELQQYQLGQQQQVQQAQVAQTQAETERTQAQAQKVPVQPYGPQGPTIYMSAQEAKGIMQAGVAGQAKVAAQSVNRFKMGPFGIYDTQTGQNVSGTGGGGMMGVAKVTPDMVSRGVPPQLLGSNQKNSDIASYMNARSRGEVIGQGAEGPSLVDKGLAAATGGQQGVTGLGLGNPGAGRPMEVGDPNNPGQTKIVSGETAVRLGMPGRGSASVTIPANTLKYFTSGDGGKLLTNFNTATQHLQLLSRLGKALEEGDYPSINSLSQSWKTATGQAAPTNFQLVREAVSGEVAKTFAGTATVDEIGRITAAVQKAPSSAQLDGAVQTATDLMQGKIDALAKQYKGGMQSKPAFPTPPSATGNVSSAVQSLKQKYGAPQ